jgi:hypothetical protein
LHPWSPVHSGGQIYDQGQSVILAVCRVAAETLCRFKGYAGGTSVDFETVENCPRQLPASVERQQVACTREHFVTRALCL